MAVELPKVIPASPYPRATNLEPGEVFTFWLGALADSEYWERMPFRHVQAPPSERDGSVRGGKGVIEGLDYWVVPGSELQGNGARSWAHVTLPGLLTSKLGFRVTALREADQQMNVNMLLASGRGYEWHYDPCPLTAVLFVTKHVGEGALCYLGPEGVMQKIYPEPGLCVVGDFSQTLHAVEPIKDRPFRITVPMGFGVPGHEVADGSDFLYGR